MMNFIRKAVANATKGDNYDEPPKNEKFVYGRPYFLGLSKEEVENSRDFGMRPIFIPRNTDKTHKLPLDAGYAECINGGKSDFNEDNSFACVLSIKGVRSRRDSDEQTTHYNSPVWPDNGSGRQRDSLNSEQWMYQEASYFGLFDGHAGYQVSVIVSRLLHKHLQVKLETCLEHLLDKMENPAGDPYHKNISVDDLVIGAFEDSFAEMDAQLDRESSNYIIKGGCTALVALFLNDKLYIANAGDCRAVMCQGETVTQVSRDFNPESERQRLNYLGFCYPELLHNEFSCTEFTRRLNKNDLGKRVLCRRPGMEGWVTKVVTEEDLRFPLVTGEGRKARVMATIGVTRGLGDHNLYVYDTDIWIKPFLSSKPEVRIIDLSSHTWTDDDVLIIGSDGLWDGVSNEEAVKLVRQAIQPCYDKDKGKEYPNQRYTIAAQELVCEARGTFTGRGWRKKDDKQGSFDDITAFVIPIKPSVDKWKNRARSSQKSKLAKQDSQSSNTITITQTDDPRSDDTLVIDLATKDADLSERKDEISQLKHSNSEENKLMETPDRVSDVTAGGDNMKTEKLCDIVQVSKSEEMANQTKKETIEEDIPVFKNNVSEISQRKSESKESNTLEKSISVDSEPGNFKSDNIVIENSGENAGADKKCD